MADSALCRLSVSIQRVQNSVSQRHERVSFGKQVGAERAVERKIMRTHSTTTITGAVLTTLLFAFSAVARDHSALNGTWTLVPAKSDFAGQAVVQTGTVTIADREGIIIVSRNFVYEGATETYFYKDITDAENNATIHTGKDLKSKTRWDRDVLKVTTTEAGAVTLESYTLAADGTMLVSVVRPERKAITLVFQRP